MKFIHLSDLHIGKRVNEFSLLDDQIYILDRILDIVRQEKPDGVLLAGDIYDKSVPSAEAVQAFDRFLTGLSETGTVVLGISGNHDSAERLAFGARLFKEHRVYLSPVYDGNLVSVCLLDQWGEVWVHLLPFLRPSMVRHVHPEQPCDSYEEAVRTVLSHLKMDKSKRNVLVAHQFVTGASLCESEELSVGGVDQIGRELFDGFDYTALGHIHSPQHVGRETVRYSGTPLKYSFSEAGQEKSATVVELEQKGTVRIRTVLLEPLRDMKKLKGTYMELTDRAFYEGMNLEDYVQITLTDEEDVPDGLARLRVIYPNLMQLKYDNRRTREERDVGAAAAVEQKTELELLEEFYELQNNQPMSGEQRLLARKLIQKIQESL